MPFINIIVAITKDLGIGKDNKLLFYISEDLKRFKSLTSGKTVIMGKNTFLSLPKGALPNRDNIVITSNKDLQFENCIMANSPEDALAKCKTEECFIIGGTSIYKQFIDIADKLYITKIDTITDADAFFPEIDLDIWQILDNSQIHFCEKSNVSYNFIDYIKK